MESVNIKICYNPNTKDYIQGTSQHNVLLYNQGKQKEFDNYIRCIIDGSTLYIRVYYPYKDIDTLTQDKIYQFSYTLLHEYIKDILHLIQTHNKIDIIDIVYNVDRCILENKGLYNL